MTFYCNTVLTAHSHTHTHTHSAKMTCSYTHTLYPKLGVGAVPIVPPWKIYVSTCWTGTSLLSRLVLGFMCCTVFLSMWLSNTSTTAMVMPIAEAVLQQLICTGLADSHNDSETAEGPEDDSGTPNSLWGHYRNVQAFILDRCYRL